MTIVNGDKSNKSKRNNTDLSAFKYKTVEIRFDIKLQVEY